MSRRYKSSIEPPSLILRLRGPKDYGWESREIPPPPAIQIEAADELQRLEGQVQRKRPVSPALFGVSGWD